MSTLFNWLYGYDGVIGMIFALIGYFLAIVLYLNNMKWRIINLENGHNGMKEIIKEQVKITREVELNSTQLKEIARATERRLQLVEDRQK